MPRVLVIEDFAVLRRLVEVAIMPLEAEVLLAADGYEGLACLETDQVDLVILDIGLPGMDGWEVLSRIRANEATSEVPVLVVTAHGDQADENRSKELGASGFIAKPFQPDDLLETAERLLAEHARP